MMSVFDVVYGKNSAGSRLSKICNELSHNVHFIGLPKDYNF